MTYGTKPTSAVIACIMALALGVSVPAQVPEPVAPAPEPAPRQEEQGPRRSDIQVTSNGIIEMQIQNGDLLAVLQKLLIKTRTNIVFDPDIQGTVTVSLYDVTLEEALDAILRQNGCGYIQEGRFYYVKTLEDIAALQRARRPLVTRTFELNYISPADARVFLQPLLSDAGRLVEPPAAQTGLDASTTGGQDLAIEDLIIVTDYEEVLSKIEAQLALVDRRPRQVLLEATIVAADLNENNALGIDFNILGGVDFEQIQFADGTVTIGANATSVVAQPGTPGGGVPGTGNPTFGELTPEVPFPQLNDTTYRFSTDFAGRVPRGGLSIGFVTDEVTAFLRALEEVTNTTVLSNPKVVVINKQVGRLLVGARNGYRTLTTTQTSTTENIEFLETGTELRFRPFISADGHVRLEVTPRDSRGSVDALGLPNENTTEVTTNILMKDGHTVVIAGLFREASSTGRSQIPLLGSIPWVGTAFGAKSDSTIKQEIIILLTVHIIDDPENYSREADHLLEDAERLRVGLRRGMQWTGRSRLAQAHYEEALRALSAGKLDWAEWHTDLAIHNRPQLVEALRLREDIRQKRDWEEDGSLVRDYIRRLMLREEGLPDTRYGRPVPHVPRPDGGDPAASPGAAGASGSPMAPAPRSDAGARFTDEELHGGMQP